MNALTRHAADAVPQGPVRAHVGLGGNIGDRNASLNTAIARLAQTPGITIAAVSQFIGTEPWGKTDKDWFLNAAVAVDTTLSRAPCSRPACPSSGRWAGSARRNGARASSISTC